MPGKFNGWLIKFGDVTLPNSFLLADGWESTPNQRVEIDAYRDANILLHRETSPNFKTKLKLNIREMNLEERMAFDNAIGLATLPTTEKNQRRMSTKICLHRSASMHSRSLPKYPRTISYLRSIRRRRA